MNQYETCLVPRKRRQTRETIARPNHDWLPFDNVYFHRLFQVEREILFNVVIKPYEGGRTSFRWSLLDPSDTNRFHRRCEVSVRKRLSGAWGLKVVPMESIGSIGHE